MGKLYGRKSECVINVNVHTSFNQIVSPHLGFFRCNGSSLRAIISRNFLTNPGLGYNSISLANKKCVIAASRAMLRPTFTGYSSFFCVLYKWLALTLANGGATVQLYGVARTLLWIGTCGRLGVMM